MVFPEPVSPTKIVVCDEERAERKSCRACQTGRPGWCLGVKEEEEEEVGVESFFSFGVDVDEEEEKQSLSLSSPPSLSY